MNPASSRSAREVRWFHRPEARPSASTTLVCFPHAGGSAVFFYAWAERLPPSVELLSVQYPGRMERMHEPYVEHMGQLADAIADAVDEHAAATGRRLVLFGHSMGASVAFEVALRLERACKHDVRRLVVSGRPGPRCQQGGRVHLSSDAELVGELQRLGATHAEVLANREVREMLLPCVRADYRLIETYRPDLAARVRCPVSALLGDRDSKVSVERADAWREATTSELSLSILPGDHFYLVPQTDRVIAELVSALELRRSSPAAEEGVSLP